jgi:hypothetical protein
VQGWLLFALSGRSQMAGGAFNWWRPILGLPSTAGDGSYTFIIVLTHLSGSRLGCLPDRLF